MIMKFKSGICTVLLLSISQCFSSSNNTRYVGCYDMTSATYDGYTTLVSPLTWEICAALCTNQLTAYVGINIRNSSCFCGNDIPELLTVTAHSKCYPCLEDPIKYCGGPGAISLYQLRAKKQTPLTLLLATNRGIEKFEELSLVTENDQNYITNGQTELLQPIGTGAKYIAHHFVTQEIYYMSSNKIYKMAYVPVLMKYYHPTLVMETNCSQVVGLALDWVDQKVYWACCSSPKTIYYTNLLDETYFKGQLTSSEWQHIVVEPFMNRTFVVSGRRVYESLNLSRLSGELLYSYTFREILQIAIDIQQETIYAIGAYNLGDSKKYLVSTNYDRTVFKVIYSGPELVNPFALEVFNGTVVWGSRNNTGYIIYRGTMSQCELGNVKEIYFRDQIIYDLKIYGPRVQVASNRYLCQKKNCSHSCSVITTGLAQCSCPHSLLLSRDGATCIEPSDSVNATTNGVDGSNETTSTPEIPLLDSQSSGNFISTIQPKFNSETRLQQHDSRIFLLSFAMVLCVAILIILVLFQICVYLKTERSDGNLIFRYNKRSIVDDPTYCEVKTGSSCNTYS